MTPESFLDGRVQMFCGDCLDVLKTLPENSIDSVVTDPPYALVSIVKRFGKTSQQDDTQTSDRSRRGADGYARLAKGFMGRAWDNGERAFTEELWAEVLRVLKPGGHVLAFGGTRTVHRLACAIEDAGFEIRDQVYWHYGSGFPKSHNVSKGIDRALGAEREKVRVDAAQVKNPKAHGAGRDGMEGATRPWIEAALERGYHEKDSDDPASPQAADWIGWGTALKPATEPIVLARKPLSEKSVAANVLKWGTGAINIDGCRVPLSMGEEYDEREGEETQDSRYTERGATNFAAKPARRIGSPSWGGPMKRLSGAPGQEGKLVERAPPADGGRWPANVITDGSEEVLAAFPDAPGQQFYVGPEHGERPSRGVYGDFGARPAHPPRGDTGSAARFFASFPQDPVQAQSQQPDDADLGSCVGRPNSRFESGDGGQSIFYSSKADADDRLGSKHPTVKPVSLIQYLVRLITPPNGIVLDCFAGTGTTGEAAFREGVRAILIEREEEYQSDIRRRMALCMAGPDERARESAKAKSKDKPVDAGPLFGSAA